jgi:hypothetical protein
MSFHHAPAHNHSPSPGPARYSDLCAGYRHEMLVPVGKCEWSDLAIGRRTDDSPWSSVRGTVCDDNPDPDNQVHTPVQAPLSMQEWRSLVDDLFEIFKRIK